MPVFQVNGNKIEFVSEWLHLGHLLKSDMTDNADIVQRKFSLIGQINRLICKFGRLDVTTKNRLFIAYCFSHYGSEIWDLNSLSLEQYEAA